jgi:hypothetical protein
MKILESVLAEKMKEPGRAEYEAREPELVIIQAIIEA